MSYFHGSLKQEPIRLLIWQFLWVLQEERRNLWIVSWSLLLSRKILKMDGKCWWKIRWREREWNRNYPFSSGIRSAIIAEVIVQVWDPGQGMGDQHTAQPSWPWVDRDLIVLTWRDTLNKSNWNWNWNWIPKLSKWFDFLVLNWTNTSCFANLCQKGVKAWGFFFFFKRFGNSFTFHT